MQHGGALLPCVPGPRLLGQAEVDIFILCSPPPHSRYLAQPLPLICTGPGGSHSASHLLGPMPQPLEPHESSSAPQNAVSGSREQTYLSFLGAKGNGGGRRAQQGTSVVSTSH